jgi:hypothetical protein
MRWSFALHLHPQLVFWEDGMQVLAGLTPSSQIVGSLLGTPSWLQQKSELAEFVSMEKCTQLLLMECIRQSQ